MLRVAVAQDSPVFLDRRATTLKVLAHIEEAAAQGIEVLAFGETFLPGYPFWLAESGGARFNDPVQKELYRLYLAAAVQWDGPELSEIAACARARQVCVVLGIAERGPGPGYGSIYCSAVIVDPEKGLQPPHRKLMPTYEERLVWAPGDGHGLRVHCVKGVRISVLNCWENWLPQARHALYALGTEVHVALWPGNVRNTEDCTRFIALEGRAFVVSASALLTPDDLPPNFAVRESLPRQNYFNNGGSAIAAPDGQWLVAPRAEERRLIVADLDLAQVARERQNFDCTGHYSRADVFSVTVNRTRLQAATFRDEP